MGSTLGDVENAAMRYDCKNEFKWANFLYLYDFKFYFLQWSIPRPRPHDEGGLYGKNIIARNYTSGAVSRNNLLIFSVLV